jgi:hypothetical protein
MFVIFALGSASCALSPEAIADVDALAEGGSNAVWQVESNGCGWKMRGSAFAIDARHLVTNRHVIANDSSPVVRLRDGTERAGKVIGARAHPDIAVIEVAEDLPAHMQWAATSSLLTREPLVVIGFPSPAYDFKASTGQIVDFQDSKGTREAALVNAPVARGNSGGPGLRGDASVAGVVTLMTIREKPEESVAILFTADAVRPTISSFLRNPSKVLSSCGLGPDYVPPVPESYEIEEAPPTAEPVEALPVPPQKPARPPAAAVPPAGVPDPETPVPATPVACPEGVMTVEVRQLDTPADPNNPGWWKVEARGLVRNESRGRAGIRGVEVGVDGDPPVSGPARGYAVTLEPGQSTEWVFDDRYVHSPEGPPTRAEATLDWYWLNSADWPGASGCPSDGVTGSGPSPTPTG